MRTYAGLKEFVANLHQAFQAADAVTIDRPVRIALDQWPSSDGWINVDGVVSSSHGVVGVGAVYDNQVQVMGAVAKPSNHLYSPLCKELRATKEGLGFCIDAGFFGGNLGALAKPFNHLYSLLC